MLLAIHREHHLFKTDSSAAALDCNWENQRANLSGLRDLVLLSGDKANSMFMGATLMKYLASVLFENRSELVTLVCDLLTDPVRPHPPLKSPSTAGPAQR